MQLLDDRDMGQETASERPVRLRQPAPAGRRSRASSSRRRSRCAPSCSTRGRSSSTTSATRARSPTSTPPTSTAGSPWPPGCSSSPTGSSPRSANGCGPSPPAQRSEQAEPDGDPRIATPGAGDLPRQPLRRRRVVAHRPLRLDLRAAARTRHRPRSKELDEVARHGRRARRSTPAMGYRYPPGAVRRLDDALLAVFGEQLHRACTATRIEFALLENRLEKLQTRPSRAPESRLSRSCDAGWTDPDRG